MKYTSEEYEELALEWMGTNPSSPARAQVYATLALAAATAGENYRGEPVVAWRDVYEQAAHEEEQGHFTMAAKLYERADDLRNAEGV